jgi:hypothetical protein
VEAGTTESRAGKNTREEVSIAKYLWGDQGRVNWTEVRGGEQDRTPAEQDTARLDLKQWYFLSSALKCFSSSNSPCFCQSVFSKTGIAKNNKTLSWRAVNLQEIIAMCLTLDLHNQEILKCLNCFIIILLLLNKVFEIIFFMEDAL